MKKINVKGVIVSSDIKWIYELFDIDCVCPQDIESELESANGDDVEVYINSPGGEVFAGSEIYTTLKEYRSNNIKTNTGINVKIVGIAASAASVIAMSGTKTLMSPTAQLMIHNASSVAMGDKNSMKHESGVLNTVDKTIANAYRIKSGLGEDELLKMMNKETWLTPQEAKEKGFVDEVMFEEDGFAANLGTSNLLPPEVINKIRNEKEKFIQEPKQKRPTQSLSFYEKKLKLNERGM